MSNEWNTYRGDPPRLWRLLQTLATEQDAYELARTDALTLLNAIDPPLLAEHADPDSHDRPPAGRLPARVEPDDRYFQVRTESVGRADDFHRSGEGAQRFPLEAPVCRRPAGAPTPSRSHIRFAQAAVNGHRLQSGLAG